jgi:hypothetical protein
VLPNKLPWAFLLFESYVMALPRNQLLDEKFKLITQFVGSSTADIEMPGECLIPHATNYYVRISRFLPRYESVEKMLDLLDVVKRIGPKFPLDAMFLDPHDRKAQL